MSSIKSGTTYQRRISDNDSDIFNNPDFQNLLDEFNISNNASKTFNEDDYKGNHMDETFYNNIMKKSLCAKCNEYGLENYKQEFIMCKNCGNVFEQNIIDEGNEIRYYNDDKGSDQSRCGMPNNSLIPSTSMKTSIAGGGNYAFILHNNLSFSHKERDLIAKFSDIDNICMRLALNSAITTKAKTFYSEIKEYMEDLNDIRRSGNREGLIGTCIYRSCKCFNYPISERDISKAMNIEVDKITHGIKIFSEICIKKSINIVSTKTQTAMDFLEKFCSILEFTEPLINLVKKIIEKMIKFKIATFHAAESQTAGCIWYVIKKCGYDKLRPKSFISQKVGVSEVTISRTYSRLDTFDQGKCPHKDNKNIDECKLCTKYKPKELCFTKYINEYLEKEKSKNTPNNNINYLISGAEIMEEKPKKKRGRKPKVKPVEEQ